jgi:internalin A
MYYTKERILEKFEQARLEKAERLSFFFSDLQQLPPEVGQLTNLQKLSLSNTQLSSLPSEIGQLTNLQELSLSNTQLSRLPSEIGQLTNLRILDLSNTQLSSLPSEIGQLTNLQELSLSNTQLSRLPSEIGQLINLKNLFLDHSPLHNLPIEIYQLIMNLEQLHLDYTHVKEIPVEIKSLVKLEVLDLNSTHLEKFDFNWIANSKLVVLDLRNTPILQKLPVQLGHLVQQYNGLFVPLDSPPIPPELEITGNIYSYLQEVKQDAQPLNEAKLILVGEGAVGKTSLVNRLVRNHYDEHEKKTDGIAIEKWHLNIKETSIKLNIWDFGGQEIMHATHQFFLTKRSVYLLVLDARRGEQESRLEYWLKLIESFGENSPIIVVINKSDQHPLDLNRHGLKKKYRNIVDFIDVSCKSGQHISQLKQLISNTLENLDHIRDVLPKSWFKVKETLEQNTANFIDYQRYVEICEENKIGFESMQKMLLGFLHDLGVVLNFQEDNRLKDTNVLKPEWVTQGIYNLLNNNTLFQSKGVLTCHDMQEILDQSIYPVEKHQFLLNMMEKFELCFSFENQCTFLIPELLQKNEIDVGFDEENSLKFQYHYDVLPSSVFSRLIVRMHDYLSKKTYWRTGVVLTYENEANKALIKADLEDKKISIFINGNEPTRRVFLGIIREHLNHIHKTIAKITPSEKIPYKQILIDYNYLLKLERLGRTTYIPEGEELEEEINIVQILNGISPQKERIMSHPESPKQPEMPWWGTFLFVLLITIITMIGAYFIGLVILPILMFILLLPAGVAILDASRKGNLTGAEIVTLAKESLKRFYLLTLFRRDIEHQKPQKTDKNQ